MSETRHKPNGSITEALEHRETGDNANGLQVGGREDATKATVAPVGNALDLRRPNQLEQRSLRKAELTPVAQELIAKFNKEGDTVPRIAVGFLAVGEKSAPPPYQYDLPRMIELAEYAGEKLVRQTSNLYDKGYRYEGHNIFLNKPADVLSGAIVNAVKIKGGGGPDKFLFNNDYHYISKVHDKQRTNELTCRPDYHVYKYAIDKQIHRVAKAIENIGRGRFEAALDIIAFLKNEPFQFTPDDLEFLSSMVRVSRFDPKNKKSVDSLEVVLRRMGVVYNDDNCEYENDLPEAIWWVREGRYTQPSPAEIEEIRNSDHQY